MVATQGGEKDIFRDTWVRYLGMNGAVRSAAWFLRFKFNLEVVGKCCSRG